MKMLGQLKKQNTEQAIRNERGVREKAKLERGNEPLGVEELQSLHAKDSGEKQQNTQQVVGNEYGVKHEKPKAKPGSGNKTQE